MLARTLFPRLTVIGIASALCGARCLAADTPAAAATDDDWRRAAERRIEQHRTARIAVKVTDKTGAPVPSATVKLEMQRHQFGFGALVGTTRWDNRPNAADAQRHLELIATRFNKAVTIIRPDDPLADRALDWFAERAIAVRGHYLMWGPVQPDRNRSGQPKEIFKLPADELPKKADAAQLAAIRAAAFAHVERTLAFAGPRVAEWDAINHIANDNHISYATLFGPQIYADLIKHARTLAPHAQMWVNDGNVLTAGNRLEKYQEIIRELIARGAKPDGIGFMSHFREGELTPPAEIYRRLETFAALVPNLQLTELDIDMADEKRQGEFMRDVLTIAFSHPAVSGIVMWQIWGQAAGQKTLWRPDWSIKPAGQAWLDQVFKAWWTSTAGSSGADGVYATRGFHGDYFITVTRDGRTQTLKAKIAGEARRIDVVL